MNRIIIILSIIIPIAFFSCKRLSDECDPNKTCYTDRPDSLWVQLQMVLNAENDSVLVKFYKGNVDDGELQWEYYSFSEKIDELVPVGNRYSAEAYYKKGDKTIIAVDGDRLDPDYFYNCEEKCYEWEDDMILDLKISD